MKRPEILCYENSFAFPDPLEGSEHILRTAIQGIADFLVAWKEVEVLQLEEFLP